MWRKNLIKNHAWSDQIQGSFNYEESKDLPIEDLYNKVIAVCHRLSPSPIYNEFIDGMKTIAEASNGVDEDEAEKINSFSADLIERFKNDLRIGS